MVALEGDFIDKLEYENNASLLLEMFNMSGEQIYKRQFN